MRRKNISKSATSDNSGDGSSDDKEDRTTTGQKKKVPTTESSDSTKTPSSIPSSTTNITTNTNNNNNIKTSVPKVTKEKSQENTVINSGKQQKSTSSQQQQQQELPKSSKNLIKSSSLDDEIITTIATNKRDDSTSVSTASITISPAIPSRLQFNIPPPPRQTTSSIQSSVVTNAKSRIYDSPKHPNNINKNSLNSLPGIVSSFKPPKQVNVSKAREKWEGGEPFILANSRRQRNLGKKTLLSSWSVSSANGQSLGGTTSSSSLVSNVQTSPSKSSVKQLLARGSVLERVQQFEKSPSDNDNNFVIDYETNTINNKLIGSGEDSSINDQLKDSSTEQADRTSSKQTYKSRVSLASDSASLNQVSKLIQAKFVSFLSSTITRLDKKL